MGASVKRSKKRDPRLETAPKPDLRKIQAQLRDAKRSLEEVKTEMQHPDIFKRRLLSFLSGARSVIYCAQEQLKGTSHQIIVDDLNRDPIVHFLGVERDLKVHFNDMRTRSTGSVVFNCLAISSAYGRPDCTTPFPKDLIYYDRWFFADWPGNEDALSLCDQYLLKLQQFVEDGERQGFLK